MTYHTTPPPTKRLVLGMDCFWGAEKRLSVLPGVVRTEVGYAGGTRINPTYQTVLSDARRARSSEVHTEVTEVAPLDGAKLQVTQLVVFKTEGCPSCLQLDHDILHHWKAPLAVTSSLSPLAPSGWQLEAAPGASPTTVLFQHGKEISRFSGYRGDAHAFWNWLGRHTLTPQQQEIAFHAGTECAFSGSLLDNPLSGTYIDLLSGQPLFRSNAKFSSPSGWPSFFEPIPGALTLREDLSRGIRRTEVLSASSGIHLGHVFDDGPAPTGKRYCINSAVLNFVSDPHPSQEITP